MGAVQLPDELQRAIDRQVAEGRAASAAAFVEEAVLRLLDDARAEEDEIVAVAEAGIADIEAGRFITIETPEDMQRLSERWAAYLRDSLASGS
jgi:Arc/MetJ-type ribon-helix-helix transcriptional regulator